MSAERKIAVFAIVLALGALAAGVYAGWKRPVAPADVNFIGVHGDQFAMSSLKGKVVLVNFWATSCTVCVSEMPKMVQTFEKYRGQGLEAVAVAMSYDPPDRVFAYVQQNKLPFRVTPDIFGKAIEAFGGIRGTPTTFLVDRSGKIVQRFEGEPDFAMLGELIEKELLKSG
ncbi:MAG: TlpA family protein disulfide reductase [Betaproteobacteria bacterium]|nr:TlpA family protein disulfide reductase [Betaproteobacteria bacterium]